MDDIFFLGCPKREYSKIKKPGTFGSGLWKKYFFLNHAIKVRILLEDLFRQVFFSSRGPFEHP